ncbi:hypothetical protein F5148DRAFT_1217618 [Russula earlei]|uniref:Uncharacterized protein n=1 Tax=Russula earlei TaxID=71964 RepID=A0ACC0U4C3_9AGAM|nr:hypothetical protein F5148DRAFT_1217618 [Russula earlei]
MVSASLLPIMMLECGFGTCGGGAPTRGLQLCFHSCRGMLLNLSPPARLARCRASQIAGSGDVGMQTRCLAHVDQCVSSF